MKKLNLFIYLFVGLLLVVSLNGYVVRDDVDEDDDDYNGINRPPSQDSVLDDDIANEDSQVKVNKDDDNDDIETVLDELFTVTQSDDDDSNENDANSKQNNDDNDDGVDDDGDDDNASKLVNFINSVQDKDDEENQRSSSSQVRSLINEIMRKKRFLGSIFGRKKTTTPPTTTSTTTDSTTSSSIWRPTSSSSTRYIYPVSSSTTTTAKAYVALNVESDPFYLLKKKCNFDPFDSMCRQRKSEMLSLISRCDALTQKNSGQSIAACKEILSVYCYVFQTQDLLTCMMRSYDPYVPGKSTSAPGSSTRASTSSTAKPITISIITASTSRPTTPTTTKSTTTTPRVIITPSTFKPSVVPVTPPKPVPQKPDAYPFDLIPGFSGTLTNLPEDENTMRAIGNYCVKPNVKDKNCDKMLVLLKEKFKTCEKLPGNDSACQSFKLKFCSAYPQFPNCKVQQKPKVRQLMQALRYLASHNEK